MRNHRRIVARAFGISSFVLGVPSLMALLSVCAGLFLLRPAPDKSGYLDIGTYGIAGLLANSAHGVGKVLEWLGTIATWIEEGLAIGLLGAVLLAVALYFIGRGIERHTTGARIAALGLASVFVLFWLTLLLSLPRDMAVVPGLGAAAALYVIWVMGWRYA
jgi:hypothetical protein